MAYLNNAAARADDLLALRRQRGGCPAIGLVVLAVMVLAARFSNAAPSAPRQSALPEVTVDLFYEPGCEACENVRRHMLPRLEEQFGGLYRLRQWDVSADATYLLLVRKLERLKTATNESVIMVVDDRWVLAGWRQINTDLLGKMELAVARHLTSADAATADTGAAAPEPDEKLLMRRFQAFTWLGVAMAGLVDGVNPCAISTLVFFLSLLAVMRFRGKVLILVGAVFCTASFLTYLGIGFGLFRFLYLFRGFPVLRRTLEGVMLVALILLALVSFRDALVYHRERAPGRLKLQLPESIKGRIHRILHKGVESRRLVLSSFLAGMAVTVLESVCTGQVYVPALVLILKTGCRPLQAFAYLLLYNVLFVLPLIIAFALTYQGLHIKRLLHWSRTHVAGAKTAAGTLFLILAVLLFFL